MVPAKGKSVRIHTRAMQNLAIILTLLLLPYWH